MLQEKETLLKQYILITKAMLAAVTKGKIEEFFELLDQRELRIKEMTKLDHEAGEILMNDEMRKQLQEIVPFEERIQSLLEQMLSKLGSQVRSAQNETFLTKKYEETTQVSGGIFYDKQK